MKPQDLLRSAHFALPCRLSADSAPPNCSTLRTGGRFAALGTVLLLVPQAGQTAFAQQGWPQNPQYAQTYAPQGYAQQPYSQPQYQQPQYQQPQYSQPQYAPQPQYAQQPYADPGPGDPQQGYAPAQGAGQPFGADQLEQLVAPIALYPDTLVAQILAASTSQFSLV